MSARTVKVVVQRYGAAGYVASTAAGAEAWHRTSAQEACRSVAAEHFGEPSQCIHLEPLSDGVMIARVTEGREITGSELLWWAAAFIVGVAIVYVAAKGGWL